MKSTLDWLARAPNFHRVVAYVVRAAAALVVPFSLVLFFKAGKTVFDLPPSGILGGMAFELLLAASIYGVVQILLIRARDIEALPNVRYFMFALTAMLVRGLGEALAVFVACVAIGGGVYVWFTARGISSLLGSTPMFIPVFGDTTFMGGIEFMVGGLLSASALMVGTYLAAQALDWWGQLANRESSLETSEASRKDGPRTTGGMHLRSGTDD